MEKKLINDSINKAVIKIIKKINKAVKQIKLPLNN